MAPPRPDRLHRIRFESQIASGNENLGAIYRHHVDVTVAECIALGCARPFIMIFISIIIFLMHAALLIFAVVLAVIMSDADTNPAIPWCHVITIHCIIVSLSIVTLASSHIVRLSIRFMQNSPDALLHLINVAEISLIVLAALTFFVNIGAIYARTILPSMGYIRIYIVCSWIFILYHGLLSTLVSRPMLSTARRVFSTLVADRIELHGAGAEFGDVEETARDLLGHLRQTSEISIIVDAFALTRAFQRYRKIKRKIHTDLEKGVTAPTVSELEFYRRAMTYAIGVYGAYAAFSQIPRLWLQHILLPCVMGSDHLRRKGQRSVFRYISWSVYCISAFTMVCDVKEDDVIIDGLGEASLFQPAFVVFVDHSHHQIWMALSGSSSMEDVLTDLHAHPRPVNRPGFAGVLAHGGMWRSAENLHRRLLGDARLASFLNAHPAYEFILTGHSLGAAAASALVVLLRDDQPPSWGQRGTRVVGFGCPPLFSCPMNLTGVDQIVVSDDVVAQLTVRSVKYLIAEMAVLTTALRESPWRLRMPRRWTWGYASRLQEILLQFFNEELIDVDAFDDEIADHFVRIAHRDRHVQLFVRVVKSFYDRPMVTTVALRWHYTYKNHDIQSFIFIIRGRIRSRVNPIFTQRIAAHGIFDKLPRKLIFKYGMIGCAMLRQMQSVSES